MTNLNLDPTLNSNSYTLGKMDDSILLLSKNALYPWFIIVPNTHEIELYKMNTEEQMKTLNQVNLISSFIENNFRTDKINIASIGNIVSQLHIHVIGRNQTDACWPNTVWGNENSEPYQNSAVELITKKLQDALGNSFVIGSQ